DDGGDELGRVRGQRADRRAPSPAFEKLERGEDEEDGGLPAQAHGETEREAEEDVAARGAAFAIAVPQPDDERGPERGDGVRHGRLLQHVPREEGGAPDEERRAERDSLREVAAQGG